MGEAPAARVRALHRGAKGRRESSGRLGADQTLLERCASGSALISGDSPSGGPRGTRTHNLRIKRTNGANAVLTRENAGQR